MSVLPPLLVLLAVGCSKGPSLVPVSGRVMMDGKPLANAIVTFRPVAKDGSPATESVGTTDGDGKYTLKAVVSGSGDAPSGAVAGKHKVMISLFDRSASYDAEGKHIVGVERVPAKYNKESGLEYDVPAGGTDKADFLDLKSR
jgi:hypothetical protein